MKAHNFYAGPSILPQFTIDETIKALKSFTSEGLSVAEISHRSKDFIAVLQETQSLFKELLNIPNDYHVIFLGGGARLQFAMIPMNLLKTQAAYLRTGEWASAAIKEAKFFGKVVEIANPNPDDFSHIPSNYSIPSDVDYFHVTTNNTVYGTEIRYDIDSPVPLVADMSSDIFSRPVDVSKYAMIYGGAQKNLAPAGVTFIILRKDILGKVDRMIPTMLDYRVHIEKDSLYNTPPCLIIYAALQTLKWLKNIGGVSVMEKLNLEKAALLYSEIDKNQLFEGSVAKNDRSIMNICFRMSPAFKQFENEFLEFATKKGMVGIKGYRTVGGFRASLYNALPLSSVQALIDAMQEFEKIKC